MGKIFIRPIYKEVRMLSLARALLQFIGAHKIVICSTNRFKKPSTKDTGLQP